jgi:hypothetical protein
MTRRPQSADDPLWDEEQPASEPTRTARTGQERRFEPSMEDRAWAAEASERGAFLPTLKGPGLTPPSRKRRGKWGGNAK